MTDLLYAPIIIPFAGLALSVLAWNNVRLQRAISLVAMFAVLGAGLWIFAEVEANGILAVQAGDWDAPFGITLVADLFSAAMVIVAGTIGVVAAVYSIGTIDDARERHGYWPLMNALILGVCGAFLAGDLFNLYVWFEVMLISSFVLLALGNERPQLEAAIKYVTLNLVSSALFLSGAGLVYGVAGTLNMADLARVLPGIENQALVTALAMMFMVAFGIKAAAFPLFSWLPASYHTPPPAVSALFAGLLTKVGVYALIRVFTLIFTGDTGFTHNIILVIAGLTMVSGVLGAIAQHEIRRILSFHIVSQIGYMLAGLGLYTTFALAGAVFYVVHHIIVKTALFLVGGWVARVRGTSELDRIGGLYKSNLGMALLFAVPALSLAGIPPFSGFFAKLAIARAGIEAESYWIVAVAIVVGLLTVFSMAKIWLEAFWKPAPFDAEVAPSTGSNVLLIAPIGCLAAISIAFGLSAGPVFDLCTRAAEQLMNRELYIEAVLGVPE